MTKHLRLLAGLAALLAVGPANASAQVFNTAFGGAGYSCLNQSAGAAACGNAFGGRPMSNIWTAGDYWRQSVSGSGIGSLGAVGLNLNVRNFLLRTSTLAFDVLVNGTLVGSTGPFSQNGEADIFLPLSFSFAAISAATYDIEVRVVPPTVPPGDGSFGLYTDGESTIQLRGAAVPEPATAVLLLIGAASFGVIRRRRTV